MDEMMRIFSGEKMEEDAHKVKIERPLYDQQQLRIDYSYHKDEKHFNALKSCKNCDPWETIKKSIPILEWLPKYKWKEDFSSDLISGFTVAIMHLSQGMAYSMLGNVPPVVGIYMAFFPVLMYFLLGHSRHNSMGTFAVVCLMTGKVVLEYTDEQHSNVEVATAVTFVVAVTQLLMFVFRLGIVSTLLSETLVSGFTTGAAIHVFVSQIKDIFGLTLPKDKGNFVNVLTIKSIINNFNTVNYTAVIISAVVITISYINNEFLKQIVAKRSKLPIPMELICVVVGTIVSNVMHLKEDYLINIVGEVPSGLPAPKLPPLDLIGSIWMDAIMIGVVSYTITLSMGLIFAQKFNYEVDANQELLAQGAGNMLGSFFTCMPFTASLSRSMIQTTVGGKTQIVSVVSCTILFFVLLWIGPYFEQLPKAVLAGIIVVALKGMLMQVKDFLIFWSLSKMDAAVWMVTFLTVTFIGIDIGLMAGVAMSLISIFALGFKPYTCLLGTVPHTDLYLDLNRYKGVKELQDLKIFHYQGSINFASKNLFKSELYKAINIHPQKELALKKKYEKLSSAEEIAGDNISITKLKQKLEKLATRTTVKSIILDFSALSYIDSSGVTMLKLLSQEFQRIDIPISIAGCSEPVYEMMCRCDLLSEKKSYYKFYPTLHDAVQQATNVLSVATVTTISRL